MLNHHSKVLRGSGKVFLMLGAAYSQASKTSRSLKARSWSLITPFDIALLGGQGRGKQKENRKKVRLIAAPPKVLTIRLRGDQTFRSFLRQTPFDQRNGLFDTVKRDKATKARSL